VSISWQTRLSGQTIPLYDKTIEVEIIIERPTEALPDPVLLTGISKEGPTREIPQPPPDIIPDPQPTMLAETPEAVQALNPPPTRRKPIQSTKAQQPANQATAGDNASVIDAYRVHVAAQIARNKPANSFAATAQGVAMISFTVAQDGQAGSIKLTQSSGNSTLDQEAIATIKRSSPFPAPPAGSARIFTVPINFQTKS
jgi:protein TonB